MSRTNAERIGNTREVVRCRSRAPSFPRLDGVLADADKVRQAPLREPRRSSGFRQSFRHPADYAPWRH